MSTTYNGTLKKWNTVDWDILYPKTIADNIISGVLALARIPTMDAAHIPALDASKIGTGTIDVGRLPAIAITNVISRTTMAVFLSDYTADHNLVQGGDVIVLTTDKQTYIHNGGTAWTAADLTLLQTPTDVVTSVAGKTGVVTLVKGDVGLGNVDNTADTAKPVSTAQQTALNLKANKVTITAGTKPKITYNADGIVTAGADLAATDIPTLTTAKITGLDTALAAKAPILMPAFQNAVATEYAMAANGVVGTTNIAMFTIGGTALAVIGAGAAAGSAKFWAPQGDVDIDAVHDINFTHETGRLLDQGSEILNESNFQGIYLVDAVPASPRPNQVVFEY